MIAVFGFRRRQRTQEAAPRANDDSARTAVPPAAEVAPRLPDIETLLQFYGSWALLPSDAHDHVVSHIRSEIKEVAGDVHTLFFVADELPAYAWRYLLETEGMMGTVKAAKHPNAPGLVLAKLAQHQERGIRMFVAENRSTPPDVLSVLANDEYSGVRDAVAANPSHRGWR